MLSKETYDELILEAMTEKLAEAQAWGEAVAHQVLYYNAWVETMRERRR